MLGAIYGDIVGSSHEFNPIKTEEFPLFDDCSDFTDDSVMTIAIADALMNSMLDGKPLDRCCVESMQRFGRMFPNRGYGGRFAYWLITDDPKPYNSWGNGSAMRVSPVGWIFDDPEDAAKVAAITAAVTHNHPEGIKGAQAVAVAICLARTGLSKFMIKRYLENTFGYDLEHSVSEIRPGCKFDESCQGSVPQAIICFLDSRGFEDTIRKAVSLGGDADTQACIAGSIAEAYYTIPQDMQRDVRRIMDNAPELADVMKKWDEKLPQLWAMAESGWDGVNQAAD